MFQLLFSHFINTSPWHTSDCRQNNGQDWAEKVVPRVKLVQLDCWIPWGIIWNAFLFGILSEIENRDEIEGGGKGDGRDPRVCGNGINHQNKSSYSLFFSPLVALLQSLSSYCCESMIQTSAAQIETQFLLLFFYLLLVVFCLVTFSPKHNRDWGEMQELAIKTYKCIPSQTPERSNNAEPPGQLCGETTRAHGINC